MALSPVRRRGFASLRAEWRWRPLLWTFAGIGVGAALVQLPGGRLWRLLVMLAAGAKAATAIAAEDRRRREAETLHGRPPRAADLDRAPAPSGARRRRTRRLLIGAVAAEVSLMLGGAAGVVWIVAGDRSGSGHLDWWFYLVAPLGPAALGIDLARLLRTLRRLPDPAGLPRSRVTVLGFTGPQNLDVVLAPGVLAVAELLAPVPPAAPGAPEPAEPPTAFATRLGWHLGELIPGDVLVCDGELAEGAVVALATDEDTDWTTALRVVPWSELREPSLREVAAEAWREAGAERRDRATSSVARRGGRRVAVRQPDGSLRLPSPDVLPPPG